MYCASGKERKKQKEGDELRGKIKKKNEIIITKKKKKKSSN